MSIQHIVCILSDTFRYDILSGTRDYVAKTPNLDAFAQKALSFNNFMCSSFPTLPNRIDLFTGKVGFPHFGWGPMPVHLPTMAEILNDNNYMTQIIFDAPNLEKFNWWVTRGFYARHAIHGQEGDVTFLHCNDPVERHLPEEKIRTEMVRLGKYYLEDIHRWINWQRSAEIDYHCAKTCLEASRWLDYNYKADNTFLWVDIFDPHEPWDPPEYFVKQYDPDYSGPGMVDANYGLATAYSDSELSNMNHRYSAEVTFVDKWIGFLLQKIEDVGWMDNTIIVFTSDHGIQLGEHGHVGKGNRGKPDDILWWPMYSQLRHIPFMIYVPGVTNGDECEAMAQPQDLLPTIIDLLNLKTDAEFEGISFKEQIFNPHVEFERKFSISGCNFDDDWKVTPTVTSQKWAYISIGADGKNPELYYRLNDPQEKINVIDKHPEVAKEMKQALHNFLKSHGKAEDDYLKLAK